MPAEVQLHPNVSFCRVSGTFVFLDAGKDKYSCLKGEQAGWFEAILDAGQAPLPSEGKPGFLDRLIADCVLTQSPSPGQPLAPCQHPPARTSLLDTSSPHAPTKAGTIRFLATWLAYALSKRPRTIQGLLQDIRKRKERIPVGAPPEEAKALARRFHALAPYFITRHDACLSRSYLLMRYLASAGVKANWVFGVQLSPFSAHCWVEHEGCVLNEHLDTALEFQPILCA
jgi:hypothetical protein